MGIPYTNATGKPIMVIVSAQGNYTYQLWIFVNGQLIGFDQNAGSGIGGHSFTSFIVPPGHTYQASISNGWHDKWYELR